MQTLKSEEVAWHNGVTTAIVDRATETGVIIVPSSQLRRLPRFSITSCHEFEVKKVKEEDRAKRKEVFCRYKEAIWATVSCCLLFVSHCTYTSVTVAHLIVSQCNVVTQVFLRLILMNFAFCVCCTSLKRAKLTLLRSPRSMMVFLLFLLRTHGETLPCENLLTDWCGWPFGAQLTASRSRPICVWLHHNNQAEAQAQARAAANRAAEAGTKPSDRW